MLNNYKFGIIEWVIIAAWSLFLIDATTEAYAAIKSIKVVEYFFAVVRAAVGASVALFVVSGIRFFMQEKSGAPSSSDT